MTHSGLEMFPVKEIKSLAMKLRVEHMAYRGDQFVKIRKLFELPEDNPLRDNALFKEGRKFAEESRKFAEKFLPKKKVERRKIKRSLVE